MKSHYPRMCTECGKQLETSNPKAKTCSTSCRAERSRRLRRQKSEAPTSLSPHQAQVAEAVRTEAPDIGHHVIQEELRPIVREAITEDVMRALNDMVAMAPAAVAALNQDLYSEDSKVRQKAYDLWLRYTVGHSAIVRPEEGEDAKQLIVNFQLPRPGAGSETHEVEAEEVQELRTCNTCGEEKDSQLFVAASDRCTDCHDRLSAKANELLSP